jgi:small conductance mechanosensitive channel
MGAVCQDDYRILVYPDVSSIAANEPDEWNLLMFLLAEGTESSLDGNTTVIVGFVLRGLTALAVFAAFWVAGVLLRGMIVRAGKTRKFDRSLAKLFGKAIWLTLLVVGGITALETAGVDVTALVAGLGVIGFALGFAMKDIVSNVVSGILIIMYKPFRHGDRIKVSSFAGVVSNIDLRYTTLDSDGTKIFVPNSLLFTIAISVDQPTANDAVDVAAEPDAS